MFIVMEIQVEDSKVSTLVNSYVNERDAESKYHNILAAAAKSGLAVHSAILILDNATPVKYEHYSNGTEPSRGDKYE